MGDPKNIKTGSSLTGGKGYLDVEASKKVAPATGTGYARKSADIMIENKQSKADVLRETGKY